MQKAILFLYFHPCPPSMCLLVRLLWTYIQHIFKSKLSCNLPAQLYKFAVLHGEEKKHNVNRERHEREEDKIYLQETSWKSYFRLLGSNAPTVNNISTIQRVERVWMVKAMQKRVSPRLMILKNPRSNNTDLFRSDRQVGKDNKF